MYVLADNRTEQKPKVSIIMPCYNHGKYVVDAIESVLNQTYQDYEFIVLENGSLDNSREVILQYRDKIDVIFGVDVNSIFGVSRLTEHCRGDYIAVIYSDDFWESEKLEKQMEAIEKYKVDFCFSQAIFTAEDLNKEMKGSRDLFKATNKKREKWIRQFFEHGNCLSNPSVVYKREYMDMVMDTSQYRQLSDYDRWMHVLLERDIYVVPEVLVRMRRHSQCVSVVTRETAVRTRNEKSYIDLEILEAMTGELFAEAYEDVFSSKWESEDELLAQKIILSIMYAQIRIGWHTIALTLFYKYYHTGNVAKILTEKYGFQFEDLHKILGEIGPGAWESEKKDLEEKIRIKEERTGKVKEVVMVWQKWKAALEEILKAEEDGAVDWNNRKLLVDYLTDILKYLFHLRDEGVDWGNVQNLDRLGEISQYLEERDLDTECWNAVLESGKILERIFGAGIIVV